MNHFDIPQHKLFFFSASLLLPHIDDAIKWEQLSFDPIKALA